MDGGTVGDGVAAAARRLSAAGVQGPVREARLMAASVIGSTPETVFAHPELPMTCDQRAWLDTLALRRAQREPLAYVLGVREFWSLCLRVTSSTLTPRPDSETLVEAALNYLGEDQPDCRVLDLGTGCGSLLLAVLSERPGARGIGLDLSEEAAKVAFGNAVALGLDTRASFLVGDWTSAIGGRFDLIVANPPYIPDATIDTLDPEVAEHEPRLALAGGQDGVDAYRAILPGFGRLLRHSGVAVVEFGLNQAASVIHLGQDAGLQCLEIRRDLSGIERCVVFGVA